MQFNINFCTENNDNSILDILKSFQKTKNVGTIYQKIFHENGAPYIFIKTNLSDRPLKLLIDTGASLSLISNEIISDNTHKKNCQINLYGLIGKEMSIRTHGMINGNLIMQNQLLDTTFHIVDKKYSGPGDGYLGYDFLSLYKTHIDLDNMYLEIKLNDTLHVEKQNSNENLNERLNEILNEKLNENLNEIVNENLNEKLNENLSENLNENFLYTIAQSYEFEQPIDKEISENKLKKKI